MKNDKRGNFALETVCPLHTGHSCFMATIMGLMYTCLNCLHLSVEKVKCQLIIKLKAI